MIRLERVSVTYPDSPDATLREVSLEIPEGEFALVIGPTGSGKSTLLGLLNGLVPHFTGGTVAGRVLVDGRDTAEHDPRHLADLVGVVPQDPMASFVADTVEEELAYAMEWQGIAPETMRRRVEETLDLLGLADLRDRPLLRLSGGQRQRVAIGAALTAHPRILVLDEPTSALDPGAAEEVLAALHRLVHDLGVTVVLAEHRLERVLDYADRVIVVPGGAGPVTVGSPAEVMVDAPVAPPVVRLGRLAQWEPLPLTVRDARRRSGELRSRIATPSPNLLVDPRGQGRSRAVVPSAPALVSVDGAVAAYGPVIALRGVTLGIDRGEIVALMGRNGAGKSTLLNALVGLRRTDAGRVSIDGLDPATLEGPRLLERVGLVPQQPADLLGRDSVARECQDSDRDARLEPGTTAGLLADLAPDIDPGSHPRDLSEGQRLSLALAVILAAGPDAVLLDEPTRGLDYPAKDRLVGILRGLAARGQAVILATHDVELVAEVATRVVILAEGEIVADGPTREVVLGSPLFAPQVAKVLSGLDDERTAACLTPGDVARLLAAAP